jgi:hypothetical protein
LDTRRALISACIRSKPPSWMVATGACRPARRMLALEPALTKASTSPAVDAVARRGQRVAEGAVDHLDLGAADVLGHHRQREFADLPVAHEAQAGQAAPCGAVGVYGRVAAFHAASHCNTMRRR